MLMGRNTLLAYNVQTAVDAEHALIVANTMVPDQQTVAVCNRWLKRQRSYSVSIVSTSWLTPVTPMESRSLTAKRQACCRTFP